MGIEEHTRAIVEQLRELLACQAISFMPACPDKRLRHPLLELMPMLYSSNDRVEQARATAIWHTEEVQALADLAQQRGRMQVYSASASFMARWQLSSIAAFPLELSQGMLGVFLLLDERVGQFGEGEERLLYACVPMHVPALEQALWEQARKTLRAGLVQETRKQMNVARPSAETEQFIKSEIVSMIGHELRAPLSVIKGYTGLLQAYGGSDDQGNLLEQEQILVPEQQRHYLDVIMQQTGLLELLVADLLDISRLQRGQLTLHPRAVDIGALCKQVIGLGQVRAEQTARGKYQLECKLAAHLPLVQADAARLQQVLLNLLENAIKYSPEGGKIELEVALPARQESQRSFSGRQSVPTQVSITIRDQGIGMPMQQASRLFQPFERLELPATSRIPGMGLGLYIARTLVEAMHGTIELESCEGHGTNVTICLPIIDQGQALAPDVSVQTSSLRIG